MIRQIEGGEVQIALHSLLKLDTYSLARILRLYH